MKNLLRSIVDTATFKQSSTTFIGTLLNGLLGALFYILSARALGPSNFGLLTVSIVTLTLITDIADFGTNTGLVRHVSASLNSDKNTALKFLKLSLEFKILMWLIILILGFLLSPIIATQLFNKSELTNPLKLVMVGVGGALLFSFATSSLQAFQKYFIWSLVNILTNAFRLFFIISLLYFNSLNLNNSLLSYILLPFFGFSLSLLFLPSKQIFQVKQEFSVGRQFFKYNFWVGIFTIIAAVSARMDTFLTARFLSNFEIGIYGAANQLASVVPQLIGALGVVAAPKFSSFTNNEDMLTYLKKFQVFVLGLSALGLLAIPASFYIIPLIFGPQYKSTVIPFVIIFIAMLIFLISIPIHNSIIYYFGKPNVFVWVSIAHLILITCLGFFMITNFGVIGISLTVLAGTIFNFLAPLVWFLIRIKNGQKNK